MTQGYRWRVAAVVALGLFMAILDNTIVSVTLPQMQKAFHTDFETITWVASAYFLAQAAVIPMVGYLSDRIGSKLMFLAALALFTTGSALCALAPTKEALIVAILVLPAHNAESENQAGPGGRQRFDFLGLVLSLVGFSALVYGITEAGSKGWGNATVLTFILVG